MRGGESVERAGCEDWCSTHGGDVQEKAG